MTIFGKDYEKGGVHATSQAEKYMRGWTRENPMRKGPITDVE